jgi:hypothetical protein
MKNTKEPLSDGDIESKIASVCASMAVEGMRPSEFTVKIMRDHLNGKITEEEAVSLIKRHIQEKNK